MAPLRLGLVGVGRWGTRYLETIRRSPHAQLSAVTTSRPSSDLFPDGCAVFSGWPRMLDEGGLDGVVLAVPPALHRAIAEACVERRLPVLIEKPMATSVEDAEAIAAAAQSGRVPVMVDHTYLFSPAFGRLRQLVGPGPLTMHGVGGSDGPVRHSVDPLWDWGPHDVAMTLALAGSLPVGIEATRDVTTDGRSLTRLVLQFAFGDSATLVVGNAMAQKTRFFKVEDGQQAVVYDDLAAQKLSRQVGGTCEPIPVSAQPPLDRVVEEFVRTVGEGRSHASVEFGVDVVRVLESANRRLGRPVGMGTSVRTAAPSSSPPA